MYCPCSLVSSILLAADNSCKSENLRHDKDVNTCQFHWTICWTLTLSLMRFLVWAKDDFGGLDLLFCCSSSLSCFFCSSLSCKDKRCSSFCSNFVIFVFFNFGVGSPWQNITRPLITSHQTVGWILYEKKGRLQELTDTKDWLFERSLIKLTVRL